MRVFPLKVTDILSTWVEMRHRDRKIVSLQEAIAIIRPEQNQMLEKFRDHWEQGKT